MGWLFLALTIVSEVSGTTMMKYSNGFTKPLYSVLAILFYIGTLALMTITLKHLSIGITYAVWSGVGILLVTILGLFLFGESMNIQKIVFIALILVGTVGLKLSVET